MNIFDLLGVKSAYEIKLSQVQTLFCDETFLGGYQFELAIKTAEEIFRNDFVPEKLLITTVNMICSHYSVLVSDKEKNKNKIQKLIRVMAEGLTHPNERLVQTIKNTFSDIFSGQTWIYTYKTLINVLVDWEKKLDDNKLYRLFWNNPKSAPCIKLSQHPVNNYCNVMDTIFKFDSDYPKAVDILAITHEKVIIEKLSDNIRQWLIKFQCKDWCESRQALLLLCVNLLSKNDYIRTNAKHFLHDAVGNYRYTDDRNTAYDNMLKIFDKLRKMR